MITFIVQKTDLLNGLLTSFRFSSLKDAKHFVRIREALTHIYGMVYDYKIKLLDYEC